jgi:hypothetical protein
MRALSASELLSIWEQGLAQPASQRALTLLAAACPDAPPGTLAQLSIGQRDSRLLRLREWTFGPQLVSLAACPKCGERLELTFSAAEVRVRSPTQAFTDQGEGDQEVSRSDGEDSQEGETLALSLAGCHVRFRLPNSLDLAAAAALEDAAATRQVLLERCVLHARQDDQEIGLDQLPADVIDTVVEHMARADPQGDVELALVCPACSHEWQAVFDIVSFFWSEIDAWAQRTLREVHSLASAYGWREADILAMSPWRRRLYLEMISGS